MKRPKKKAKIHLGRRPASGDGGKIGSSGKNTSPRDEEVLVDYEPEEPAAFSPIEDDISIPEDHTPTLEEGPADISLHANDLPAYPAENANMAERKRRQNVLVRGRQSAPPTPTPKSKPPLVLT